MKTFAEFLNEKFSIGMGDTRTDKELLDQVTKLTDKVLLKWFKSPPGMLGTKLAKTQHKMVVAEIKKRKLE